MVCTYIVENKTEGHSGGHDSLGASKETLACARSAAFQTLFFTLPSLVLQLSPLCLRRSVCSFKKDLIKLIH
jgi:hypothetical protein